MKVWVLYWNDGSPEHGPPAGVFKTLPQAKRAMAEEYDVHKWARKRDDRIKSTESYWWLERFEVGKLL